MMCKTHPESRSRMALLLMRKLSSPRTMAFIPGLSSCARSMLPSTCCQSRLLSHRLWHGLTLRLRSTEPPHVRDFLTSRVPAEHDVLGQLGRTFLALFSRSSKVPILDVNV